MDPVEIRRRNFLQPTDFPHRTPNGAAYDSGDYPRMLDTLVGPRRATTASGARQAERRARGELVGIGLATFIENTSAGWESGAVRVEADGSITVISGAIPMGQGVETVLAQIVADALGVRVERLTLRFGDTALTQAGDGLVWEPEHGGRRQRRAAGGAAGPRARRRCWPRGCWRAPPTTSSLPTTWRSCAARRSVGSAGRRSPARPTRRIGRPVAEEPGLEAHAFFGTDGEAIALGRLPGRSSPSTARPARFAWSA